MKKIIRTLLFLGVIIIAANCKKDESFSNDGNVIITPTSANPITATVQGIVFDENNNPTVGVSINAGSKTATTDAKGFFRITNAALDKNASVVLADKVGYFKAYRTFQATSGANFVVIKLIKKELIGTISNSGGTVMLTNGSSILLPANAVVKKAGGAYSGSINVYAAYIDPTKNDIAQTIPGSFMADDKNGKRVTLKSYVMLAVELESTTGEKLQIAEGKTAQLKAPIPASLSATAPATIAMWYVDEQTGIWKEQGTATKTGNTYVGNVSHFSFWNYDASFPAVNLSFTLKTTAGLPLINTSVILTRSNGGGSAYGYTDSYGQVSGLVPSNESLLMSINDNCNNTVHSQNIGPFSQNTSLGDIYVNGTNNSIISVFGKLLDCSGLPVTNGTAILYYEGYPKYVNTNINGDFNLSFLKCTGSPSTFTFLGVDNTTQQQSLNNTYTIISNPINLGNILTCGSSSAQFINYTFDGANYSILSSDPNNIFNGSLSSYTGIFYNYLQGSNNNINRVDLNFESNVMTNGIYPITFINVRNFYSSTLIAPSNVLITTFPQSVNEFYEGSFSANFKDSANLNIVHSTSGVFRLRRKY
jgi:hypothetical protein